MRRMRKGQVTLFVILGILIIVILAFLLYSQGYLTKSLLKKETTEASNVPASLKVVSDSVQDCLKGTSENALLYVSAHGGYYNVPLPSISYFNEDVPYYYINNTKLLPTINIIQNEISSYIKSNLDFCLNINYFRNQGFVINTKNYTISTSINDKSVLIRLDYPITIKKGQIEASLTKFDASINSNLKDIIFTSNQLVNNYAEKPGYICLTCLDALTQNKTISVETIPVIDPSVFKNNIIWYIVKDNQYLIKNNNIKFIFIVES